MTTICDDPKFWVTKVSDIIDRGETTPQLLMAESIKNNWRHYITAIFKKYSDDLNYPDLFLAVKNHKGIELILWFLPYLIENAAKYQFTDMEKRQMCNALYTSAAKDDCLPPKGEVPRAAVMLLIGL